MFIKKGGIYSLHYLVGTTIITMIGFVFIHMPIFKISNKEKRKIIENGLIHFTDLESVQSIMNNGLVGSCSHMGYPETLLKELIWFFVHDNMDKVEEKHTIAKKFKREGLRDYNVCIKITGIDDHDINKLRCRLQDDAIAYHGKLLNPQNIEILKQW